MGKSLDKIVHIAIHVVGGHYAVTGKRSTITLNKVFDAPKEIKRRKFRTNTNEESNRSRLRRKSLNRKWEVVRSLFDHDVNIALKKRQMKKKTYQQHICGMGRYFGKYSRGRDRR